MRKTTLSFMRRPVLQRVNSLTLLRTRSLASRPSLERSNSALRRTVLVAYRPTTSPGRQFTSNPSHSTFDTLVRQSNEALLSNLLPERLENLIERWESHLLSNAVDAHPIAQDELYLLRKLYQLWRTSSRSTATDTPYKSMFHIMSRVSGKEALSILQDWEVLSGNIDLATPAPYYDATLRSFASLDDDVETGAKVAVELIHHLERSYNPEGLPSATTYCNAIQCLAKAIPTAPPEQAADWFKILSDCMDKLIQNIDPTKISVDQDQFAILVLSLHHALVAYGNATQDYTNHITQQNVQEWRTIWMDLVNPNNKHQWIRVPDYTGVLDQTLAAFLRGVYHELKSLKPDFQVAISCTQLLLSLGSMLEPDGNPNLPSGRHYQSTIRILSRMRADQNTTGQEAISVLLERMKEQHERFHHSPETNEEHLQATESWNNLLRAHLDVRKPQVVQDLWARNAPNANSPHRRIRRNAESYNIILQALAARREPDTTNEARRRAVQAHKIVQAPLKISDRAERRFHPTADNIASVMIAWERSYHKDAAQCCSQLFEYLIEEAKHSPEMEPNEHHCNALLLTWGYSRHPDARDRILDLLHLIVNRPITVPPRTYSAMLFGLGRSTSNPKENAEIADRLVAQMEHASEQDQASDVLRTECYNSLMHAQCRHPETSRQCEATFQRHWKAYTSSGFHKRLRPNTSTFAFRINALVASHQPSADRAEEILNEMESLAKQGQADTPGLAAYTAAIKACWKDRTVGPERAQQVLERMEAAYAAGNDLAKPDIHVMTLVMLTWARSDAPHKASVVWNILQNIKQRYVEKGDLSMKPTPHAYSAVLNACAFTTTDDPAVKEHVVRIALEALQELGSMENGLNQFAFRNMLQVVSRQVGNQADRERMAQRVFQRCCQEGYVDSWILHILKQKMPSLYTQLPTGDDIPAWWCRHITKAS